MSSSTTTSTTNGVAATSVAATTAAHRDGSHAPTTAAAIATRNNKGSRSPERWAANWAAVTMTTRASVGTIGGRHAHSTNGTTAAPATRFSVGVPGLLTRANSATDAASTGTPQRHASAAWGTATSSATRPTVPVPGLASLRRRANRTLLLQAEPVRQPPGLAAPISGSRGPPALLAVGRRAHEHLFRRRA